MTALAEATPLSLRRGRNCSPRKPRNDPKGQGALCRWEKALDPTRRRHGRVPICCFLQDGGGENLKLRHWFARCLKTAWNSNQSRIEW